MFLFRSKRQTTAYPRQLVAQVPLGKFGLLGLSRRPSCLISVVVEVVIKLAVVELVVAEAVRVIESFQASVQSHFLSSLFQSNQVIEKQ